ncbi:MAG: ANTAR domain-containing protein [Acidimicrobiia bacterium]
MTEEPEALEGAIRSLSRLLLSEEPLETTLGRVAGLACRTIPGCEMASLTMMRGDRPSTAVQTDPEVEPLDTAQYQGQGGPCLEAYATRQIIRLDVARDHGVRWPEFTEAARDAGFVSVLAVPLTVGPSAVGALNLFSKTTRGFTDADEETAGLFSEQAAVACVNAEVYWRTYGVTENLREALESRDVIGQAKGILMARRGCSPDDAFEALRKVSMRRNVKLRVVADEVVYTGDLDDGDAALGR